MKIAVVGGGSTYTPELVSGLAREQPRLDVSDLVLQDIDADRREVVGGMARRMLARAPSATRVEVTGDLDRALDGADAVLVQIRVGGQTARLGDETVPLACGCVGQETTGAGGLAKALRTVPVVLEIAARARARAAPGAWIVDFTNPVGIVTRALLDGGHRAVGLCNVAITLQRSIAQKLGVEPARVLVDQVGLNHLTWVRGVRLDGREILEELLTVHGDALAAEVEHPRRLLDELGAIPSYYLRYFYAERAVIAELGSQPPRARTVMDIERALLALYADPAQATKPPLLEQRGGSFYSEAATALVASLRAGTEDVQVVDMRNAGTLAGLADDDVVEVPARIGRQGPVPLPQAPLEPELLGLVQHVAAYERLAAQAAVDGDPRRARKALLTHPLVREWQLSEELLERLAAGDAAHLARFRARAEAIA
jgi:6-phospho-beta-glucosidase